MKKILLPVDGSKRSLRTVEAVKQLCDPAESDITIVKVVSAQLYINSMDEIKHNAEKAQPELDAVADLLPGYQVKTQVLLGSAPGAEIVEYAKEEQIDMIIMTRSSRGPLRKLGSVATYIVRNASFLDVIVMREVGDESKHPLWKTPTLQAHSKQHDDWRYPHEEDPTAYRRKSPQPAHHSGDQAKLRPQRDGDHHSVSHPRTPAP